MIFPISKSKFLVISVSWSAFHVVLLRSAEDAQACLAAVEDMGSIVKMICKNTNAEGASGKEDK